MNPSHQKLDARWQVAAVKGQRSKFSIRYALFRASPNKAFNRCIVFLNGRSEWIEKYQDLPLQLGLPDDCAFLTMDHQGQGASGGKRAHVNSYDEYIDDARCVIEEAVGQRPYALICHSMGGLIAVYGNLMGVLKPQAMVLSAPLFYLPNAPIKRQYAEPLIKVLSMCGLAGTRSGLGSIDNTSFSDNILTHDYDMYMRIMSSPYPIGSATFGWIAQSFKASKFIFDPLNIAKLSAPTLVFSAEEEKLVDNLGHTVWIALAAKHAPLMDVQLSVVSGAYHEIFAEAAKFKNPAMDATRRWLADFFGSPT